MTTLRTSRFPGPAVTRRRLGQSAATAGALLLAPWPLRTAIAAPNRAPVLSGTEFALAIEPSRSASTAAEP